MVNSLTLIGSGLLVAGTAFLLLMKKRRFDRTNSTGVEQLESYARKLEAVLLDKSLVGLSAICIIGGAVFLAYRFEDTWVG
jgi:hypothetical protein